jgi:hypothetical protein
MPAPGRNPFFEFADRRIAFSAKLVQQRDLGTGAEAAASVFRKGPRSLVRSPAPPGRTTDLDLAPTVARNERLCYLGGRYTDVYKPQRVNRARMYRRNMGERRGSSGPGARFAQLTAASRQWIFARSCATGPAKHLRSRWEANCRREVSTHWGAEIDLLVSESSCPCEEY